MELVQTLDLQHAGHPIMADKFREYNNEIGRMTDRMIAIACENEQDPEFISGATFFRDELLAQLTGIEEMMEQVKLNDRCLIKELLRNPIAISKCKAEYYEKQNELLYRFEQGFSGIRENFNWFCLTWI